MPVLLVHVLDCLARFLLNALDQFGNFLGGLGGLFRQLAHFVGDHGESQTVFPGAGRFDGGIQGQQVGLLRQIVDDFDDLADVVGPLSEHVDDFAGRTDRGVDLVQSVRRLLHGGDTAVHFLPRTVGDIEQHFGGIRDALNGGHHLVDGGGSLADAGSLHSACSSPCSAR